MTCMMEIPDETSPLRYNVDERHDESVDEIPNQCNRWSTEYLRLVEAHPLPVKSVTATIILGSADLLGQLIQHLNNNDTHNAGNYSGVDWPRMIRFSAFGLFGAPWSHYYFEWLDQHLPPTSSPWTWTTVWKVCIDQFIQAPILLAIMIFMLSLMKGDGISGAHDDLSTTFIPALIANWKLWVPASAINMVFVRPSLRVLYINVVFFIWTVILSLMLN